MDEHQAHCHHCVTEEYQWRLGRNLKITGIFFLLIFFASFLPQLHALNAAIIHYLSIMWWAILLGLLIGGLIDYFIPESLITRFLGTKKYSSILYAVLAGFFLSVCSHGILAIAMQLYKKGAGIPAVISFLLASPWANLTITILLFSFFGFDAIYFIAAALVIALITGSLFMFLDKKNWIENSLDPTNHSNQNHSPINYSLSESIKGVMHGSLQLSNMVLWWMLIGILTAAILHAYVPIFFVEKYFGPNILGIFTTLGLASIIEVCSEGSAPIAFEIYDKIGVLGNPFVFLMAGVATDYTEIGLLWTTIGKKTAIWMPLIVVPLVVIAGIMFNLFL